VLIINHQGFNASVSQLNGGGKAGRSSADNENGDPDLLDFLKRADFLPPLLLSGKDGKPFNRFHPHSGLDEFHAGLERYAVCKDKTLGTLSVGAENSLRGLIFRMMPENADSMSKKSGRKGFARTSPELASFPGEGNIRFGGRVEYGVLDYAMHG
jgi:hypothetical protein